MTNAKSAPVVPNHHRDQPGFSGLGGLVAGLTMIVARGPVGRLAVELAGITDADRVVDVGCGPGTAARRAARKGADVVGVDPAPVMLKLAGRLTRDSTRIYWRQGAAEGIPLPDCSASVLWSISTVHHWSSVETGLAEAHRVLAPDGRLVVLERRTRPGAKGLASHGWTDAQAGAFADVSLAAGFTGARVELRTPRRRPLLVVQAVRP
jgi:SAM-dependent methyltransferase